MTPVATETALPDVSRFRGLVETGAWFALASVVMIAVQIGLYLLWPPPDTTVGFFEILVDNPVRGLVTLDAAYIVSNLLAYVLYFALAVTLWRVSPSGVVVALAFGTLGMAAYMASPRAVEMLTLAQAYTDADPAERAALVATGDGMLATWAGTAYDVYYVFNCVTLVLFSVMLLRSRVFSRATAWWALVAAVLMAVPSNVGVVGMVFAMASLVPWSVFAVLVWRRLLLLAQLSGRVAEVPPT